MRKNLGSDFDDFLKDEGLLDKVEAVAIKKVITYQLKNAMKQKHVTKSKMAEKMHTSRSSLDRLFDPKNTSVTLNTLVKAAYILGKKLRISIK